MLRRKPQQNTDSSPRGNDRIYQEVTMQIIDRMMQGEIPWRQTWVPDSSDPDKAPFRNPYSKTTFSFLNQVLLGQPGLYATFNQIKEHGGHILKGSKARKVFFWTMYIPKKDKEEAKRLEAEGKSVDHLKLPMLKEYQLFNLDNDTEGLKLDAFLGRKDTATEAAQDPTDVVDMVIDDYRRNESVTISESAAGNPSYDAASDTVTVPLKRCFNIEEDYYASLVSGLVHSTAQESRNDRRIELKRMKEGNMSVREELIAEIGSSMVLSACGLERNETHEQIASQCQRWMEVLQKDYRILINAATAAEKSARYIMGNFSA